jgi:endonuclease III
LVQDAIREQLPRDYDSLIRAHQLLRQHGQELCKRSKPKCSESHCELCVPTVGRRQRSR